MSFDVVRATVLALIQGLTEFLPISSSAHLILPSALLGWPDQGLGFDIAVHLGTLLAVVLYFRLDLWRLATGSWDALATRRMTPESRQVGLLALATLPVVIVGFLVRSIVEHGFREVETIATTTVVFGILLGAGERVGSGTRCIADMRIKDALVIGLAQILALIPGTSRSGITTTAALFCGMDRVEASRFSFLLSIPVIGAAATLLLVELLQAQTVNWSELAYGVLISGVSAYCCIHLFLSFINRIGFMPFVYYRILLGAALWAWLLL